MRLLLVLVVVFLSACATASSSLQYTEGTEALERGDYEKAATLLREAVRLDPSLSRNHNNLASALFELGQVEEGWPHVRKAVSLDPSNKSAAQNSKRYVVHLLKKAGLNVGSEMSEVVKALGEPDTRAQKGTCLWYQYGISALCFENGKFASIGDMERR